MRVALINAVSGKGSTGRIAADLAFELRSAGKQAKVFFGRGTPSEKSAPFSQRIGSELSVRLHTLRARLFDGHGEGSKRATRQLIGALEEYAPDIIHLHNPHGYYLNDRLFFSYLAKAGVPVVWTLHDAWALTGHCCYFDRVSCERYRTGCGHCPQRKRYPKSLWLDRSAKHHRIRRALLSELKDLHLVTPSRWLAGLMEEAALPCRSLSVIPNGIDRSSFSPTARVELPAELVGRRLVLGVSGAWDEGKGLCEFLFLSERLPEEYKIVLIGCTERQRAELAAHGIYGVCHTDSTEELAGWYAAAEVFVNPTLEDNFPTVNLEALSCGTPILVYRTGGTAEAVAEGCGTSVARGDREGLLCALLAMQKTPAQSDLCRKASEAYGRERMLQNYLALYESLI